MITLTAHLAPQIAQPAVTGKPKDSARTPTLASISHIIPVMLAIMQQLWLAGLCHTLVREESGEVLVKLLSLTPSHFTASSSS